MLTVAQTGAGKGTGVIIPALLSYPGNAVVLDLKGENYAVTARRRSEMGQKVYRLDPFGVVDDLIKRPGFQHLSRYGEEISLNPMDSVEINKADAVDRARAIAEMLVVPEPGTKDPHWNDMAKSLLTGLILYTVYERGKDLHNLFFVRKYLSYDDGQWGDLIDKMMHSKDKNVRDIGNEVSTMNSGERRSVLSTARRHTEFLRSTQVFDSIISSDEFLLEDLNSEDVTVYIIMPPHKTKLYFRLMRLWINAFLETKLSNVAGKKTLFLLDEMAQLGTMDPLCDAMSIIRGYGGIIWGIIQNVGQLKALYNNRYEEFLENTTMKQFFGVQDLATAKYVSEMAGNETIVHVGETEDDGLLIKKRTKTKTHTGRELITASEVIALDSGKLIQFTKSCPAPILCEKLKYYEDAEFAGQFDVNPYVTP